MRVRFDYRLPGCIALLLAATSAIAHHSAASHYLLDQEITVKGVVKEFRLINPHARIYIDVTDEDGNTVTWLAEGNASSVLKRRGWTPDTIPAGVGITITGAPARDGGPKIDWVAIRLEDGTELRGGNTKEDQFRRQLEDLDKRRNASKEEEQP